MFRVFGKVGHNLDQIWTWLPRGHRLAVGVRNPLKSSVTGPSLLVNCYLETKFHKKIRVNPPTPPPPPLNTQFTSSQPFIPNAQYTSSQSFIPNTQYTSSQPFIPNTQYTSSQPFITKYSVHFIPALYPKYSV